MKNELKPSCCTPPPPARSAGAGVLLPPPTQSPNPASDSTAGMIFMPGGQFVMGTDSSEAWASDGEGPVREVKLSPFLIDSCTSTTRPSTSPGTTPPPTAPGQGNACRPRRVGIRRPWRTSFDSKGLQIHMCVYDQLPNSELARSAEKFTSRYWAPPRSPPLRRR